MGVVNEKDKKLRAMQLVQKTVLGGQSIASAAKDMGISHDTAERTLAWARKANLFVEYEQRLYDDLLPLAHDAIKLALQDGDAQVALKIMEAVGLGPSRLKQTKAQEEDQEGLYGEIAKLRRGSVIDVSPQRRIGPGMATVDEAGTEMDFIPGDFSTGDVHGLTQGEAAEGQNSPQDVDEEVEG